MRVLKAKNDLGVEQKTQFFLGKTSIEKVRLLSGIARISYPLPPIRATWSSFFRTSKRRFARMTEKNTIDYNNGFNDNYNNNDGNFDDNDDKKHTNIISFE